MSGGASPHHVPLKFVSLVFAPPGTTTPSLHENLRSSELILQAPFKVTFFVKCLVRDFVIWAFYHTSKVSFEGSRQRGPQSSPESSSKTASSKEHIKPVIKSHRHRARPPSLGWGIMSRMAWSTRTTRKMRTRTMSRCMTLRAAAPCCQCSRQLPLQPPGCTTLRASVRFACPEARDNVPVFSYLLNGDHFSRPSVSKR